jgi:hypothetical protein
MDEQQLRILNQHKMSCPRHWTTVIQSIQNETLTENYARDFSEYLPPIRGTPLQIKYVGPLNNQRKPFCQWIIYFTHTLPIEIAVYGKIAQHVNQNKPRNTKVKLSSQDKCDFCATYTMCCECKRWDFCVDDETKLVNSFKIKLEELA